MDEAFYRAEIESSFIIFECGIVIKLPGNKTVSLCISGYFTGLCVQAYQTVGSTNPQVFIIVRENAESNITRHPVFYGIMKRFAGLKIILNNPFYRGKPHVAFFIFTRIIYKIMSLCIQLVVRQIHTCITDRIVVETTVEHTNPYSTQTVFVNTVRRERGKLRGI